MSLDLQYLSFLHFNKRFWKFYFLAISIGCIPEPLDGFYCDLTQIPFLSENKFWMGSKIFFETFFGPLKIYFRFFKELYMHNTPIKFDAPSSKDLEVTALQSLLLYKHCRFCNFGGCSWSRSDNGKASKKLCNAWRIYDCVWRAARLYLKPF